jgi:hypothetical protein
MKNTVILFLVGLLLTSCTEQEDEALIYYRQLTEMHNELIYQVHLSLNETKVFIALQAENPEAMIDDDLEQLRIRFDSVLSNCNLQEKRLREIGPMDDDSLIYKTFLQSIQTIKEVFNNDFKGFLASIENDASSRRINVLYSASMQLADAHIARVESILAFNEKHDLNLDTLELILSKSSTEKFQANISIIHNSVPIAGNTVNGYGQLKDVNGSLYTGHFSNGLFHGTGKLEYPDGDFYEGEFRHGSFHGNGTYHWSNGAIYRGEWRDDLFNGIGTMISETGDTTYGYWLNGVYTKL